MYVYEPPNALLVLRGHPSRHAHDYSCKLWLYSYILQWNVSPVQLYWNYRKAEFQSLQAILAVYLTEPSLHWYLYSLRVRTSMAANMDIVSILSAALDELYSVHCWSALISPEACRQEEATLWAQHECNVPTGCMPGDVSQNWGSVLSFVNHMRTCELKIYRKMASSGMLRCVALVGADVSEERSASIIWVTRIGELGTKLAVTSDRRTLWRNESSKSGCQSKSVRSHSCTWVECGVRVRSTHGSWGRQEGNSSGQL
jgi:hypothetical protein